MRTLWLILLVAACGDDGQGAVCGMECASDCVTAGFGSGTCVDDACQCTAAVPPGALTGKALLFGHQANSALDHAAITVTLDGTSMSTMTLADGSYAFTDVPPGTYSISFAKPKFIDQREQSIVVTSNGSSVAPEITLSHGSLIGALSSNPSSVNGAVYSPDRTEAMIQILEEPIPSEFSLTLAAVATDGSHEARLYNTGDTGGPLPQIGGISNDAVIFTMTSGVWSRAFDAAAPARLLVPTPGANNSTVRLQNVTEHFAVVRIADSTGTPSITYVAARTDGSTVTSIWIPTSASPSQGEPGVFLANDQGIDFVISDTSGTTTAIHQVDPATGNDTSIALTGYTSLRPLLRSPDRKWELFAGVDGANQRAVVLEIGTANIQISPPGFMPNYNNPVYIESMADSSGFTFEDWVGGYSFFGTTVAPSPNPIRLVPTTSYAGGSATMPTHLYGSVVAYTDKADTNRLKLVTVPTAAQLVPATYDLDAKPGPAYWQVNGGELDGVWAVGSPIQWRGVTVTLPLTTSPTAATLGPALTTQCTSEVTFSRDRGVLTNAFFFLCPDTHVLSRFSPPFAGTLAATVLSTTAVSMQRLTMGGVAYQRGDGTWWAADATAQAELSAKAPSTATFTTIGDWAFFSGDDLISRVSRRDGAAIDEPLIACELATAKQSFSSSPPFGEPAPALIGTNLFAPTAVCPGPLPTPFIVPQTNLP